MITEHGMNIGEMKAAHKRITRWEYQPGRIEKGYNDRTLHVDLSTSTVTEKPVTPLMKDKFIGGKGFGLYLLWHATKPTTQWNDPENEIIISPGPCAGITQYAGAGKSLVVSISSQSGRIMDSNVGGYFGPYMKFAGFDAIELQGKANEDVIIVIDGTDHSVTIETAPKEAIDSHVLAEQLTEMYAKDEKDKINVAVVSAGTAADHSLIGMLNFSFWDPRRKVARLKQAGRGGIGTVFRDKRIKALVCKTTGIKPNWNNVVDLNKIIERGQRFQKEIKELDDKQCEMRDKGTAHLMEIMDAYDLLPTTNFRFGKAADIGEDINKIHSNVLKSLFNLKWRDLDGCWFGCAMSCCKSVDGFELKTGPYKGDKVTVDGPEYETAAGLGSNCGIFDPLHIIEANFYCDTYGICTITVGTITAFVMECYEAGILNKERTGGLELKFGNSLAALELIHQMATGKGFGAIAGRGAEYMKHYFADQGWGDRQFLSDIAMVNKGLEYSQYMSKESLAQQGGYAMTNKGPQHDEAWLIFMDMVNNQIPSFEDKAEALYYFPMFRTWFGLCGFCKLPWNDVEPENNREKYPPKEAAKVPEHVDNYLTVFKAVTGRDIDKDELILQSARVYNFQRIFNIRRGYGLRQHDAQPYRACGPVTKREYESRQERYDKQLVDWMGMTPEAVAKMTVEEKIAAHRKYRTDRYEKLLDAVYKRRGWTRNGVPTIAWLKEIGMDLPEVIEVVKPLQ